MDPAVANELASEAASMVTIVFIIAALAVPALAAVLTTGVVFKGAKKMLDAKSSLHSKAYGELKYWARSSNRK